MKRFHWASIILLAFSMIVTACGGSNSSESTAAKPKASEGSGTAAKPDDAKITNIKIAYPSIPDFTDISSLLVWDNPPAGLKVSYEFMAKADLAVQGVVQGDYDIGSAPAITVLQAIAAGMPIKIFAEQMKNEFALMTPSTITSPDQLQGKRLAIHGPNTLTDALVRSTVKKYNLDKAKVLTIPGSEVRTQALLKGEIDATPAEVSDVVAVQKTEGSKYHVLLAYSKDYPLVNGTVFFTTDKYLQQNSDKVKLLTKALLEGYRKIYDDPNYLKQNANKFIKNMDQNMINDITDAYLSNKIMDVNGGISKEAGEYTINFNKETGLVEGNSITFEKAYNTKIVDDVLKEIGKR